MNHFILLEVKPDGKKRIDRLAETTMTLDEMNKNKNAKLYWLPIPYETYQIIKACNFNLNLAEGLINGVRRVLNNGKLTGDEGGEDESVR